MPDKNAHMLIFRGNEWHKGLSPEEMQRVSDQWMAWFRGLSEEGRAIGGNPLENSGKIVSGPQGRVVADGPFTESKESIGGYIMLQVADMEEAVAIAQNCPGLPYGIKVEVRKVLDVCPTSTEGLAQAQLAEVAA